MSSVRNLLTIRFSTPLTLVYDEPKPLIEIIRTKQLSVQMATRAHLTKCDEIIRGASPEGDPGTSGAEFHRTTMEVSSLTRLASVWGLKILQQYKEEILSAYRMLGEQGEKYTSEKMMPSKILCRLFSNATFCQEFHEAMLKAVEAKDLDIAGVVETHRRTEAASKFLAPIPAVQTAAHNPPAPRYNPAKQMMIGEVISNRETIEINGEMFYFSFGVQLENICPNPIDQEKERMLKGLAGHQRADLLRLERMKTGFKVLLTAMKEELSRT